jgi:hypothetical protein
MQLAAVELGHADLDAGFRPDTPDAMRLTIHHLRLFDEVPGFVDTTPHFDIRFWFLAHSAGVPWLLLPRKRDPLHAGQSSMAAHQ